MPIVFSVVGTPSGQLSVWPFLYETALGDKIVARHPACREALWPFTPQTGACRNCRSACPHLVREVLDAWAFWLANPTFSTQTLEVDCGLKFSTDVPPEWIIDCEQVADPRPRRIPYEARHDRNR
jgi:hypothetical protein